MQHVRNLTPAAATTRPRASALPGRSRVFALLHQADSRPGFVEERVVSPHFAQQFQQAAVRSFQRPPALPEG